MEQKVLLYKRRGEKILSRIKFQNLIFKIKAQVLQDLYFFDYMDNSNSFSEKFVKMQKASNTFDFFTVFFLSVFLEFLAGVKKLFGMSAFIVVK